jgi:hypothetical protein
MKAHQVNQIIELLHKCHDEDLIDLIRALLLESVQ